MFFYQPKRGFTLIELMIVVTIIGILAVIAIPSYLDYTKRARFAEVIEATEPYKTAISLALQQGIPASELNTGTHSIPKAPEATDNLASLQVNQGIITATGTIATGSNSYILTPNAEGSRWTVSGSCIAAELCNS